MIDKARIFVNLPVKDVYESKQFFSGIGFEFNPKYTNDDGACMIIGENIFVMLLDEKFFQTFTKEKVINAKEGVETVLAITVNSKDEVNDLVEKAFYGGAKALNDPIEDDTVYGWSFQDIDFHNWQIIYIYETPD